MLALISKILKYKINSYVCYTLLLEACSYTNMEIISLCIDIVDWWNTCSNSLSLGARSS
jgi:hypothetical protein